MKISELGGEFRLLDRLYTKFEDLFESTVSELPIGVGDDAAVFTCKDPAVCVSVDTLVEDRHFSLDYFSLSDVGKKAIESAVSDLVAMRVRPRYVLVALSLPDSFTVEEVEDIYSGFAFACERTGTKLIGGDLTSTKFHLVLSVTALGTHNAGAAVRRCGARPGQKLCVSGPLGGSASGLKVFLERSAGFEASKEKHLRPKCRVDSLDWEQCVMSSCIDISDGLSNEVHHLAECSGCGFIIQADKIPVDPLAGEVALYFGQDPLEFALHGGEDFELLFTLPADAVLPEGCHQIGVSTSKCGVFLEQSGETKELRPGGSNRFLADGGR